ncbi:hypothetical protein PSP6_130043 [Paraburkholderia tropica]|nr:hypothetical protein PSP6_130043 [Paraburkholderia tropica]
MCERVSYDPPNANHSHSHITAQTIHFESLALATASASVMRGDRCVSFVTIHPFSSIDEVSTWSCRPKRKLNHEYN